MNSIRLRSLSNQEAGAPLSRSESAYERIRIEILTFGLMPGELVSEVSLAERYKLSLAAVRAILSRLRHEGLLINMKRRGQMVSPVTFEDINNTYQLRYLLEPTAAEQAVGKVDVDELKQLDEQASSSAPANDRKALLETILAHRAFHLAIAAACTNEQLAQWIFQLNDKVLRYLYLDLRNSETHGIGWHNSHTGIIDAIVNGEPERAADAMRADIDSGLKMVSQAILHLPDFRKLNLAGVDFEKLEN